MKPNAISLAEYPETQAEEGDTLAQPAWESRTLSAVDSEPRAISVSRGDGVGPEVVDATIKILEASGASLRFESVDIGGDAWRGDDSPRISSDAWDALRRTGILLKGPIAGSPTGGPEKVDVTLRKGLGIFANVRPVRSYAPYIATNHPSMDLVVIRENEEDFNAGIEHRQTQDVVQCLRLVSRQGCERLIRYAFEYTRGRRRKKLTCMTQEDVMRYTDGMFRDVFLEIAREYPDIVIEHLSVNSGTARVASQPERFDVIVVPKMYGHILAEVAAEVSGSVGMVGSAGIGPQFAVFEAVHGASTDMAGLDVANPSGLIIASVKMLAHIGQGEAAEVVHNAWLRTIEDGVHTIDVHREGRSTRLVGTNRFAEAVIDRMGELPRTLRPATYPRIPTQVPFPRVPKPVPKETVGIDVFVQWRGDGETLAAHLSHADGDGLVLTMITNRGIKVWPGGYPEALLTDHWRCRFTLEDGYEQVDNQTLLDLLTRIDELGIAFVKTETLCNFDGHCSYSQGEIR